VMLQLLLVIGVVILTGVLLWYLLIVTEGVYLGRRVVIWLYDLYAGRYDKIKAFQPLYEHMLLAQPIMQHVAPDTDPLMLDVATGTGRMPLAMLHHAHFEGQVIGADLSRKMLHEAAEKLAENYGYVYLLWCPAEKLPFGDNLFDVVTCIEALEFMPDPQAVIREMVRTLRPGGLLLITNRIGKHYMPGKTFKDDDLVRLLESCGMIQVRIEAWQVDYTRVWAVKSGEGDMTGPQMITDVIRCPDCDETVTLKGDDELYCACRQRLVTIGEDGVIELFPLYSHN